MDAATAQLDDFIEQYESAQERDGTADLAKFVPPRDHPLYATVLRELVRVDLEYAWLRRQPRSVDDYRGSFPELFTNSNDLQELAYEEYRLRRQAGEPVLAEEFQKRYGIATAGWPQDAADLDDPRCGYPLKSDSSDPAADFATRYSLVRPARILRRLHGQPEKALASALGASAEAEVFRELLSSDPNAADDLARWALTPPQPGSCFMGFRLLTQLGEGAFGQVFLARQGELANRLVALKVGASLFREPQTLAQLQHTHIVPVYSLHVQAPYQAVCMPYLGATTLADVLRGLRGSADLPTSGSFLVRILQQNQKRHTDLVPPAGHAAESPARLKSSTYIEAVLWLMQCVAEGLAHAHERGIVHRDLKPANVLLTDDGVPMLLDFNLAQDLKLRSSLASALVGGTLPYMAPECLEALSQRREHADPQSDLYAVGILLFELLTGRHPFSLPRSRSREAVAKMIEERRQSVPRLRAWNAAVSPATEAIVQRCLAPKPQDRYANARELAEDLRRQSEHLPLRFAREPSWRERTGKFLRRHPRLASAATVAGAAAGVVLLLLGMLIAREQRLDRLEGAARLAGFRKDLAAVQVELLGHHVPDAEKYSEIATRCRELVSRYHVLDDPAWQQSRSLELLNRQDRDWLGRELGDLFLLWARAAAVEQKPQEALQWNELAEACYPTGPPALLLRQRAKLYELLGRRPEADALRAVKSNYDFSNPRELGLAAAECRLDRQPTQAVSLLRRATRLDPQDFRIWFDLGICHEQLGQDAEAAAAFTTCMALRPQLPQPFIRRGMAYFRQKQFADASADFTEALQLRRASPFPAAVLANVYLHRALAYVEMNQPKDALEDLDQAVALPCPTQAFFVRAKVRARLGDKEGAQSDRQEGLRRQPQDETSWLTRGWAKLPADPKGALADFEQALARNPRSIKALQNQAHVLAEYLGRTGEAIAALDRLLEESPDSAAVRASRGVLYARLGKRRQALADAEGALQRDSSPATVYQVGGIYALTSKQKPDDRQEAFRLLATALRKGYGWDLLAQDHELDPIRDLPEFRRLLEKLRTERTAAGTAPKNP